MDEKKLSLVSVVFAEPYFLFYGRVLLDKIRRTALRRFFRCIPPPSFGGGRKGTLLRAPERKKGGGEASRTSDRPGHINHSRRRERFEDSVSNSVSAF